LNRLTLKTYPDSSTVNYTYDKDSRLTQVSDPTGTYQFTFDNMGRLNTTTTQYSFLTSRTFSTAYSYDAASNRTGFTDPESGSTAYVYDTLNRLQILTAPAAISGGSFGFGYDALSRRTSLTRPNAVNTAYGYDNLSRLLSVRHAKGSTTLDGATYTVDNAGNRAAKSDLQAGVTTNFGYDAIYQLLSATQGGSTTETFNYDAVGNRLSSLGVASYSYNPSNELTSTSSTTYGYDNNGNATSKTDSTGTTNYNWDFENRLNSVTLPASGGTVSFKYDPWGRRIYKSSSSGTSIYAYDGGSLIEETNSSGTSVARYAQNRTIDEPLAMLRSGSVSYYEGDGLDSGSISSLSNSAGTLASTYTYDSFGKLTNSTGSITNPFQYTAREFDSETNLYSYRARYYDPAVGRFLSEDPRTFDSDVNFYDYVYNSPLNFTDPSGMQGKPKKKHEPPQPQPNPDAAFYICCQGGTLGVCEGPMANSSLGNTNPFFKRDHLKCQKEHEQQHVDDFNAGLGSPWIPSDFCKGKKNGFKPGLPPGDPQNQEECRGYQKQLECLQSSPVAKTGALESDINFIKNDQFKKFKCSCDGQKK
jgi:RHS repeat-associated protein